MSFTPGWYLVEYGVGKNVKSLAGYAEYLHQIGDEYFLRVLPDGTTRSTYIQVRMIRMIKEIPPPGDLPPEPRREEPTPDAAHKGRKESEATPAYVTCRDCGDPSATPRPFAPQVDWICGQCGHPLSGHSDAQGRCDALIFTTAEPYTYTGTDCRCAVSPGTLKAFFALGEPERLASIRAEARAVLGATEAEHGVPAPPPAYVTCIDCGDPQIWHGQSPGAVCTALLCRCANQRSQEDRFVVPGDKETP